MFQNPISILKVLRIKFLPATERGAREARGLDAMFGSNLENEYLEGYARKN